MHRFVAAMFITITAFTSASADVDTNTDADIGRRPTAHVEDGVAITQGVIRVRRRHENDMDFSKYNPFYWEGRLMRYRIEDHTPSGINKIKFTMLTEWPQDYTKYRGPDFSAIYTGDPLAHETKRSKFAINARMKNVGEAKHFEHTIDDGAFRAFKDDLKPGKLLTIEFRTFNSEAFPLWQKQKQRNPHNLSAYYSEFIRFRIGKPGVHIDNFQKSNAMPSPKRYAGGWTTIPTVRVEPWRALQQQAFNLTWENGTKFLVGRTWFHTDFKTGKHLSDRSDDKPSIFFTEMENERKGIAGSLYNVTSCNTCHIHNGTALLPLEVGQAIHTTVVKTVDAVTGKTHLQFGNQLQTAGPDNEGALTIARFEKHAVKLDDGTTVELSKPIFTINSSSPDNKVAISPRRTPALIGMGLLEAVPEKAIVALAKVSKGEVSRANGKIGRFGWKASQPTVADQIKDALLNDMGVLTAGRSSLDATASVSPGKAPLNDKAVDELETYVALLGVPPRNNPEDARIRAGEKVFEKLNCHSCHQPTLRTGSSHHRELSHQTIHPYTDLLLHDMGEGLADEGPTKRATSQANLWRTAPLWGLKNTRDANNALKSKFKAGDTNVTYEQTHKTTKSNRIQLMHDGRARSLAEAILWHGGEAEKSANDYKALSKEDRELLEAFLWDL